MVNKFNKHIIFILLGRNIFQVIHFFSPLGKKWFMLKIKFLYRGPTDVTKHYPK